jgi:preprotein translocase subunit SecG
MGSTVLAVDPEGRIVPARVEQIYKTRAILLEVVTEAGPLRTTSDHPLGCPGGGFVPAGRLQPGQEVILWKDGTLQTARVIRTVWEERPQPVYNLSVGQPNTFLASEFLTHNKGGGSSSSSSSRSSSGGSGGGSTGEFLLFLFFFILFFGFIVFILIVAASKTSKKKSENLDFVYPRNQIIPKAEKTEKLLTFLSRQDSSVSPETLRNLAETTFVLPPKDAAHTAQVRIFTPRSEMPFAGHPNVGTGFVLARAMDNPPEHFVFVRSRWKRVKFGVDSGFLAGAHLVAHVNVRRGVVADQHHRDSGAHAEAGKRLARLGANDGGERFSVEQCGRHRDLQRK